MELSAQEMGQKLNPATPLAAQVMLKVINGGSSCLGDLTRDQPCNTNDCPGLVFLTPILNS